MDHAFDNANFLSVAEFGPNEPQYLCYSTDVCYSEQGSTAANVPAFADEPLMIKPIRLSKCVGKEVKIIMPFNVIPISNLSVCFVQ